MKRILSRCGFNDMVLVEPQRTSGGLVFAWDSNFDVKLVKMSSFFMHFVIMDDNLNMECNLLLLCISSVDSIRNDQLEFLVQYCSSLQGLFYCVGDFNFVLKADEKWGEVIQSWMGKSLSLDSSLIDYSSLILVLKALPRHGIIEEKVSIILGRDLIDVLQLISGCFIIQLPLSKILRTWVSTIDLFGLLSSLHMPKQNNISSLISDGQKMSQLTRLLRMLG